MSPSNSSASQRMNASVKSC